jgi:hypothetical protein
MDNPGLGAASIFALLAGLCFITVRFKADLPIFMQGSVLQAIMILLGTVCAVLAAGYGFDWLMNHATNWVSGLRIAWAHSERVALAEVIRRMEPYQTDALGQYVTTVDILTGEPKPLYRLDTQEGKIPIDWCVGYVNEGAGMFLKPVRDYAEGTKDRQYAEWFTAHVILLGYADRAVGNQPAKWKNGASRHIGLQAMGLE